MYNRTEGLMSAIDEESSARNRAISSIASDVWQ